MNKFLAISFLLLILFSCDNEEENKHNLFNDYIENIIKADLEDGNYLYFCFQ